VRRRLVRIGFSGRAKSEARSKHAPRTPDRAPGFPAAIDSSLHVADQTFGGLDRNGDILPIRSRAADVPAENHAAIPFDANQTAVVWKIRVPRHRAVLPHRPPGTAPFREGES
jgi:hypothetical protein